MTTRALVTGGNGFVAQWLIKAMLHRDWSVIAAGLPTPHTSGILNTEERTRVTWLPMDILQQPEIAAAVDRAQPDAIVHLAAVSHIPDARRNPAYAYEVNAVGTVRLLSEVARLRAGGARDPAVLVVGSGEQYGRHELNEMPLHEDVALRPLSLYAASKVAQEIAALQAYRSDGVRITCTRSFNHSGLGHGDQFLLPSLVRRALELPKSGGRLMIGNGDTVRDFLHVADVAESYLALVTSGVAGDVYNVCSGEGVSVRALAASVLQRAGRTAEILSDPALTRPVDVPVLVGSNEKLRRATGWTPHRTRDDIIDDLIHAATH